MVSVLLGTLVAVLINLATAGAASVSTLGGLGAAVAAWAGWKPGSRSGPLGANDHGRTFR